MSNDCLICKDCDSLDSVSESDSSDSSGSDTGRGSYNYGRRRYRSYSTSSSSYSSESEHDWQSDQYSNNEEPTESVSNDSDSDNESKPAKDHSDNDEEETPTSGSSGYHHRHKRNTHGNHHGYRQKHDKRGKHRHKGRHHAWKMTKVRMPTGKTFRITKPDVRPGWKCGNKTKMITLKPNGRIGRREHTIITKELEKTMIDIPFAIGRGGVYKKYNITKLQKLINPCIWKRFRNRQRDIASEIGFVSERMLFHGSLKAAEIAGTGFDERYANPNGVFGAGLYFAHNSSAANEYTFGILGGSGCPTHHNKNCYACERQMLLCRVSLGKQHKLDSGYHFAHPPKGHHSILGRNGVSSYYEYVIYRGEQAYPEYLITYKIVP